MGGMASSAVNNPSVPTSTSGGMVPGGLGAALQGAVMPAFQGEPQGGLKAGAGPVNHIAPMPTMTNDLVAPADQQPSNIGMVPPQTVAQPPVSPVVQQMMMRQQQPVFNPFMQRMQMPMFSPYNTGLQSLFNRFMMPQQPMMRGPMQMPQYGRSAQMNPLAYRPNIEQVQQNLSRVKPSVYKTELDAAKERIAQYEAAEEARRQQEQNNNYWAFNQG